jgi:hypothetical protein
MNASPSPNQSQSFVPQGIVNDQSESTSPSKPPHDRLSLIYWLLFLSIVPVAVFMAHKSVPRVSLPLLYSDVPAYHIITRSEIYTTLVDQSSVTADVVREKNDLIGHYTLHPILASQPIQQNQIGPKPDPFLIANTLVIAIPANSAMLLGGTLHAGDVVSLAVVPLSAISQSTIIFDRVLVLDVKPFDNQTVVILAIPDTRWLDYLTTTRNATIVLARQLE